MLETLTFHSVGHEYFSFIQQLLWNIFCVPGTVQIAHDTSLNNIQILLGRNLQTDEKNVLKTVLLQ